MSTETSHVRIEQKLEEPARFLIFTVDDALAFAIPLIVGWLGKQLITGLVVGLISYALWRRLKGEGGLAALKAAIYWFLPLEITPYRGFPDSAVTFWRG